MGKINTKIMVLPVMLPKSRIIYMDHYLITVQEISTFGKMGMRKTDYIKNNILSESVI